MSPHRRSPARLVVGVGLVVLSLFFLLGGFFAPPEAIMTNPSLIPMPERVVGLWGIVVGVGVAAWPSRPRS